MAWTHDQARQAHCNSCRCIQLPLCWDPASEQLAAATEQTSICWALFRYNSHPHLHGGLQTWGCQALAEDGAWVGTQQYKQ
jgi:hypothetical protein